MDFSNLICSGTNMKSKNSGLSRWVISNLLALVNFGIVVNLQVFASESTVSGTWWGTIKCHGQSKIERRTPTLRVDGDDAFLTNYGKYGETYESKLKKGKAKFKGRYEGFHNGEPFNKLVKAKVKILKNGDVKISGMRGRHSRCSGVLKKAN